MSTLAKLFTPGQRIPELDDDDLSELTDLVLEELSRRQGGTALHVADTTLCVSFEPEAIRSHFEADDPDPTAGLDDAALREAGEFAVSSDALWSLFHQLLTDALEVGP